MAGAVAASYGRRMGPLAILRSSPLWRKAFSGGAGRIVGQRFRQRLLLLVPFQKIYVSTVLK